MKNQRKVKVAKANTHLTHLEELVLTQGPEGYEMAKAFLLELLKTLKGNTDSNVQTSVKWDGAPAMFAGINPENGRFFVGTKSIFNKVPKINYTEEDIIKNHGHAPGLVDKLTKALKYLPSLGITKILQGDFMFDDEMVDTVNIDGEPHYRFKPNTIVYAVPVNSELGQQVGQSKFGIVFHTTYDSLDSGAMFGADVSNLKRVPGIWFDDAYFTDDTGTVTLTEDEESQVLSLVEESEGVNKNINYDNLPLSLLNIYINNEIKQGDFLENPSKSYEGFREWYSGRLSKRVDSLKSIKGKERATLAGQEELEKIELRKDDIMDLFKVSRLLFEAKNIFIQKYNNAVYNTKHFVDDGSGDLVVSNPEGYVAVDHAGNGIKFVDRLEFSRANFAVGKSDKFTGDVGLSEVLSRDFSIAISKDVTVTKTLQEWVDEISTKNHEFTKLPKMVYRDILAGTPIVDIVVQENAERTIYNAVMGYVNGLQEEDEFEVEIEDENGDPVIDSEAQEPKTFAIVPGAFKPPHAGHADMVKRYATGLGVPKADKVYVVISAPMNAQRMLRDGTPIDEDHAIELWKKLFPEVANLPNVEFEIAPSEMRSPITVAYEYIGPRSPLPLEDGDEVVLGASDKADKGGNPDWMRWAGIEDKHIKPGIQLMAGEEYAVPAYERESGDGFSASTMRDLISDLVEDPTNREAFMALSEFVPANKISELFKTLKKPPPTVSLEELSSMGGGSIEGAPAAGGGPWQDLDVEKENEEEKRKSKLMTRDIALEEKINFNTVDEVIRLIMERGIIQ